MTAPALGAILSHWRRAPGQLAALVLGLALATALWSAVQAINSEARANYARAAGMLGGSQLASLTAPTGPISTETFVRLRRAGWLVSPVLEGDLRVDGRRITVTGVDFLTLPSGGAGLQTGSGEGDPAPLLRGAVALAAPGTAEAVRGAGITGLPRLVPSQTVAPGTLLMDIGAAHELLGRPGEITRLTVLADQPVRRAPLEELAPNLRRVAPGAGMDPVQLTRSFHLNLAAFGLLSFAVGLFIVYGTIGLAFEQRRPLFRTLRALGLPLRSLLTLVLAELLALALLAGGIGLVLGYLVAAALLPDVAATLRGLYGAEVSGQLTFRPGWAAAGMGMAVGGTLVAAAQALWRTARLPVLAAAHPRAWALGTVRRLWSQGAAGGALLATAAALSVAGSGLITGFVLLGALLLGAALLLPPVLSLLVAVGRRAARGPVGQWFWADAQQQIPGLSMALMALLLALAANVGVGTMVASFRVTFLGWLDQRLAAELYVTVQDAAQADRLRRFLDGRARAVLPIWEVEGRIAGRPVAVNGMADDRTFRENWPLLDAAPGAWDRLADGTGILINEQLHYRSGLGVGDRVAPFDGWRPEIVGIYSDYGNPRGEAIAGNAKLTALFPAVEKTRFALRVPQRDTDGLRRALTEATGVPAAAVTDRAAVKAASVRVFDRTFAVTGALNILTLGVAALAILIAHATLAALRLPQLAPVWALGLTRRRLARLEVARTVALAAFTAVLALPVGLLLAWALLAVVNVQAFGWRLPMQVFPLDWLRLLGLAFMAAALAAAGPARRLARMTPARFLEVFANER
ncbi:FtsX-like permease family protein [Roseovarius salinarum]|uniref:FtsX-like permease family protein n=1 Tax=Roseovarius salinarum TaxID=1981892 RepID=UPI000C342A76|nr:FtsX-like permease family protein [Roseovarius salinarum]